jgi:xylulose-5-phosphate/fructose-6-phosphate phosphoketolase
MKTKAGRPHRSPATASLLEKMDAYWRAANYLSVGQIYLYDNPLLKRPLRPEHIKPRLLGHWGTTPGLNFIYVHLKKCVIKNFSKTSFRYRTGPRWTGPRREHLSGGLVQRALSERLAG